MDPSILRFIDTEGILVAPMPAYDKGHQSGIIKLLPNISKETRRVSHDIVCIRIALHLKNTRIYIEKQLIWWIFPGFSAAIRNSNIYAG